ncbi:MAG: hypothetical protein ABL907_12505 [Hyphomicrobium sp.]
MARFVRIAAGIVLGFGVGAAVGAALISLFSGNTHDRSVEMAMTSIFVTGPIGAMLGLIAGLLWKRRAGPGNS